MTYFFKSPSFLKTCVVMCCASVFATTPAFATITSATFQVTASVLSACVVTTPATLAFINYTPSSGASLAATTAFTVICTAGTPYSLGLNTGLSLPASVTNRKMTSPSAAVGSNSLAYGLFKDAVHTTNWDNNQAGTGYTSNGLVQPYTIYGVIPAGQYTAAPALDYADTIVLTLDY